MSSIFLSHSHADKPFARLLAADLRASGHDVWIDEAEIEIGDSLIQKIRDGLDSVDYVAAILSSNSIESEWVSRELEIASNREIDEKRVVVLPLMIEKVAMPGFLTGKFYGDFTDVDKYGETLALLLRKLGPARQMPALSAEEILSLQDQLKNAQAKAAAHESTLKQHERIAMKGKSTKLVEAIESANKKFPAHAPINATYAFEVGSSPVTLDYLLWTIGKAEMRGGHPLEILLTLDDKWGAVESMLSAYGDLLAAHHG